MNSNERITNHPYKKYIPVQDKRESDRQSKMGKQVKPTEKKCVQNKIFPLGILNYILD